MKYRIDFYADGFKTCTIDTKNYPWLKTTGLKKEPWQRALNEWRLEEHLAAWCGTKEASLLYFERLSE
jgi:hypothetical protein